MNNLRFSLALVSIFYATGLMAQNDDRFSFAVGADSAGPVGVHASFDAKLVQNANSMILGIETASRGYRFQADSLDSRDSMEGLIYLKSIQPIITGLAIYEQVGIGETVLPASSGSKTSVSILDTNLGLRSDGKGAFIELGMGLRWFNRSEPVQVGLDAIDRSLLLYPRFSLGYTF